MITNTVGLPIRFRSSCLAPRPIPRLLLAWRCWLREAAPHPFDLKGFLTQSFSLMIPDASERRWSGVTSLFGSSTHLLLVGVFHLSLVPKNSAFESDGRHTTGD